MVMGMRTRDTVLVAALALLGFSDLALLKANFKLRQTLQDTETQALELRSKALRGALALASGPRFTLYRSSTAQTPNQDSHPDVLARAKSGQDCEKCGQQPSPFVGQTMPSAAAFAQRAQARIEGYQAAVADRRGPLPALSLLELRNRYLSPPESASFTLFVFFGSTDCPYCLQEARVWERLYSRGAQLGLTVMGVADRVNPGELPRFVRQLGISFPVLLDEGSLLRSVYGVDSTPFKVLINSQGSVLLISEPNPSAEKQQAFESSVLNALGK